MLSDDRIERLFSNNPDGLYSATDVQILTGVDDAAYIIRHITKLIYNDTVELHSYNGNIELFKYKE